MCVCIYLCIYAYLFPYFLIYGFVYSFIYWFIYLPIYLSIYLSIYLFHVYTYIYIYIVYVYVSMYLCIYVYLCVWYKSCLDDLHASWFSTCPPGPTSHGSEPVLSSQKAGPPSNHETRSWPPNLRSGPSSQRFLWFSLRKQEHSNGKPGNLTHNPWVFLTKPGANLLWHDNFPHLQQVQRADLGAHARRLHAGRAGRALHGFASRCGWKSMKVLTG